jgi:hypothetical protein
MDPTVTAAAVGVGGTVIVGVTGFWAAVRNTSKTIANDREGRVWERRADVYLDVLAAVKFLRYQEGLDRDVPPGNDPDWFSLDVRVRAFASAPVWMAMQELHRARREATPDYAQAAQADPAAQVVPEPVNPEVAALHAEAREAARREAMARITAARDAGDALIDLIRAELQSRPRNLSRKQSRHMRLQIEELSHHE